MSLLTSALPGPALSENRGDVAIPDAGDDFATTLKGIADRSIRMIYIDAPPVAGDPAPAAPARLAGRPPAAPVIVVANSCGWQDPEAQLGALRQRFPGPVWLVQPQGADCKSDEIASVARKATNAPARDRLAVLIGGGMTLSGIGPSTGEASATAGQRDPNPAQNAAASLGGKLVISALPPGAALSGAPATVIRASAPAAPQAVATQSTTSVAVPATLPRRADQPEPAIIVGELASLLGADKRGEMGVPREVRDRIRQIDPDFFDTMMRDGRFDPRGEQYAAAIQTELQQMNCYSGAIDGDWGGGSLSALQRYFSTLGSAQAATVPGPALYRQIITNKSVTCPAPRVTTPRAQPTTVSTSPRRTGGGGSRSTRTENTPRVQRTPTQRQPSQQPAATQAATTGGPRIDPNRVGGLGSGVPR
ncbi:hypothetical protein FQV27_04875 [Paracoccus aurantiacus]|uniref:Uncharacterized protein n=1 Tax=Paracoccus aurantiacus TaxID=2599412 RepID=A0A5C6S9W0_9RHOB|nr:hypothetical protein [Paracoccus aurantiacus]TXB71180.1 hypothetical protein FQV27_04875 [Paracoccus aurantiacus]